MMNLLHAYYRIYQQLFRVAVLFLDWTPPKLLTGAGCAKELPALIASHGIKKVLVVTDPGLMKLGLLNGMLAQLQDSGVETVLYADTQANPTIDNVEAARALYAENACQAIIAFGGGSPMDCAKAAGARIARPNKPVQSMRGVLKVLKKTPPFYAVPTTAGTGSECTIAAVVTDAKTHEKYAINDPKLRPDYAVLDPELTTGLPKHITSTTGMDALTHAVEAYIGRSNTAGTIDYAEKATKLIFANLETAYEDGGNLLAREQMLLASHYAGLAFTRAYVGYVHAIAHNLGGYYNVPHGLANAVILPYVLDFFGESAHKKLAKLCDCAGIQSLDVSDAGKAQAFIAQIRAMNKRMGIPEKFDMIQEKDIPTIASRALREGNPLYPVPKIMNQEQCERIIRSLMA